MPLFFPVLIFMLCLWLVADKVDNYCHRFSPMVAKRLISTYRFVPILMVAWLMIVRAQAIITRDPDHIEVARRMGATDFALSDLKLLISGDGVGEFSLLFLLIFSLWTINLPSMKNAPHELRKSIQTKVMLYVSSCALLTFWVFFPESNYYSPDIFPKQPTMPAEGDFSVPMVVIAALMVAFSGELFAIASIENRDEQLALLRKRAQLKTYFVCGLILMGLYFGDYLNTDWINAPLDNKLFAVIILFSQALILALVCVPGKHSDNLLRVGEARTKSFAIMSLVSLSLLIIITSMVLRNTLEFNSGNRYLEESLWLTASFAILLSVTQILPRYGFDGAARPEYWWLRVTIVFAPAIIFWFNELAIFVIPGLWLVAGLSIIIPNLVEQDAKTPSRQGVIVLLISMLITTFITSLSDNMLGNFILVGFIVLAISNTVSSTISES